MSKEFLGPIYQYVFGDKFNTSLPDSKQKMQNLIYLLQENGINTGTEYDFFWHSCGPYSHELQSDILALDSAEDTTINYSEYAKDVLEKLKSILNKKTEYPQNMWVECLASLKYLKTYILHINASDDKILAELIQRKPYLDKIDTNKEALNILSV